MKKNGKSQNRLCNACGLKWSKKVKTEGTTKGSDFADFQTTTTTSNNMLPTCNGGNNNVVASTNNPPGPADPPYFYNFPNIPPSSIVMGPNPTNNNSMGPNE